MRSDATAASSSNANDTLGPHAVFISLDELFAGSTGLSKFVELAGGTGLSGFSELVGLTGFDSLVGVAELASLKHAAANTSSSGGVRIFGWDSQDTSLGRTKRSRVKGVLGYVKLILASPGWQNPHTVPSSSAQRAPCSSLS